MYLKEVHLNHGLNAANKKRIGDHTPENTSKNYPNIGIRTIKLNIDRIVVVFGRFLSRMNSDFVCCVVIVVQMRFF